MFSNDIGHHLQTNEKKLKNWYFKVILLRFQESSFYKKVIILNIIKYSFDQ